jgi:4-hydroxythreonine-4-phosphate dehydrogenase
MVNQSALSQTHPPDSTPTKPLALTMGEPAGVGTEIALKAWNALHLSSVPFFLIDEVDCILKHSETIGLRVPIRQIDEAEAASSVFKESLPVLNIPRSGRVTFGAPSVDTAPSVISSIETAVALTRAGSAGAVVTNPIQKDILYQAGFNFPGHTEFLGALGGAGSYPVMMLACDMLRVVPVSVHISLKDAIEALTTDLIVRQTEVTWKALKTDCGIDAPRLAIAGLNPHAGESGAMGREDKEIIQPAVDILQTKGIDARGPFPPDTLFTERARPTYDAAICMYHDQALIPIKTLDFDQGVNVTLGLPFVRTSPDHGTALEIAGQGIANPQSLISALTMAGNMAACRQQVLS